MTFNAHNTEEGKIVVYIDFATLPSVNMALHLIENYDKQYADKVIGFERFNINSDVLNELENNKWGGVIFNNVTASQTESFLESLYKTVENVVECGKCAVLELHLILSRSVAFFVSIIKKLEAFEGKYRIEKVYMYDDGSNEYACLYLNRNQNVLEELNHCYHQLLGYIKNKEVGQTYTFMRYSWHRIYQTQYVMLYPEYLSADEKMKPLKEYLDNSYTSINFNLFNNFTLHKKHLFLEIMNLKQDVFDVLKRELKGGSTNKKTVIFTGTTTWDFYDQMLFAKIHVEMFNRIVLQNPELSDSNTQIFFKPHPKQQKKYIDYILENTKMKMIPADIPFEVLAMVDLLPDYVCGAVSSVYFSLPPQKIGEVFFLVKKGDSILLMLYELLVMLKIVNPKQVIFKFYRTSPLQYIARKLHKNIVHRILRYGIKAKRKFIGTK